MMYTDGRRPAGRRLSLVVCWAGAARRAAAAAPLPAPALRLLQECSKRALFPVHIQQSVLLKYGVQPAAGSCSRRLRRRVLPPPPPLTSGASNVHLRAMPLQPQARYSLPLMSQAALCPLGGNVHCWWCGSMRRLGARTSPLGGRFPMATYVRYTKPRHPIDSAHVSAGYV